jgi:ATP-dependent DNA helicase RecG
LQGDGRLRDALKLPYAPTGAQSRTIREIEGDMAQTQPMLRLLQGDVGSGKTLVATMALLIAAEARRAGGDAGADRDPRPPAFRQSQPPARGARCENRDPHRARQGQGREATLMGLAAGEIDILIGTHAIFQQGVTYRDLGLVVVDEQHRFGVAERMMLQAKAQVPPHLLVMTATPIPRTLQLASHGEMDVSRLDEMPPGRQPIQTTVISEDKLDASGRGAGEAPRRGQAGLLGLPAGRGEREERSRRRRGARGGAEGAVRRQGRAGPWPDEGAGEGRGDGALLQRASWACWSRRR